MSRVRLRPRLGRLRGSLGTLRRQVQVDLRSLRILVAEEHLGEIMSDLQQRRAIITRTHRRGKNTVIDAHAPLANLFGYSSAMRGLSQGRATCTIEPHSYGPAPPDMIESLM